MQIYVGVFMKRWTKGDGKSEVPGYRRRGGQVWRDGRIVSPAVVASGDAGVLYFEGLAGSYSLRR